MRSRLWAIAAASAGLLAIGAAPAAAVDPLLFSSDGETWGTKLGEPLFTDALVLVPGDQMSADFWVRNASPDEADLSIMLESDWPLEGEDAFWFRATADANRVGSTAETNHLVLAVADMQARESRKITVTVGLDGSAQNSTQNMSHPIAFDVRLTQSIPDGDSGVGGDHGQPESPTRNDAPEELQALPDRPFASLADTGFAAFWVALLGAALAGIGIRIVAGRRSNKNLEEEGSHGPA